MYHKVAKLEELPKGKMMRVKINQEEVLIANVEEKIYAVYGRCGHMNAPLSMGKLSGKEIECPLHKARYDVTTGKNITGPQMGGLTGIFVATTGAGKVTSEIDTLDLKTYRTKIEDGYIKVKIP
jgi:nitrite reductase/ring-hydroxylating ferredoxin subunit